MIFLETKRLILRYFKSQDVKRLYEYRSKPEVEKYQAWNNYCMDDAIQAINDYENRFFYGQYGSFQFAICLKNGDMIGDIFIDNSQMGCFIGYTLDSVYWKKGYAFEIVSAFLSQLHDFYRISFFRAVILPENQNSVNLIHKLGFVKHSSHEYFLFWMA